MKKVNIVLTLIFTLQISLSGDLLKESQSLIEKIDKEVKFLLPNASIRDVESLSSNVKKISLELNNTKKSNAILYYCVEEDFLFIGTIFKGNKNLTKKHKVVYLAKEKTKKLKKRLANIPKDLNASKQLKEINDVKKEQRERIREIKDRAVSKYTDYPEKLLREIKNNKSYLKLFSSNPRQVLLILNPSCEVCKGIIESNKLNLVGADSELIVHFTSNSSDDIKSKKKAYLANNIDSNLSSIAKIEKMREIFSDDFNLSKIKINKKKFGVFIKKSKKLEKEDLIKGFPVIITIDSLFGKKFRF